MTDDALVEAAWTAVKPYLLGSRLDKAHTAIHAALAAAQAAGLKPGMQSAYEDEIKELRHALAAAQAGVPLSPRVDALLDRPKYEQGFAAGIEACCGKAYDLGAPSGLVAALRALRPSAAPADDLVAQDAAAKEAGFVGFMPAGAPNEDWLIDGHECTKESWDNLDWSTAWMDKGPSPAGNMRPYWHVMDRDGDCQHRLYFKPLQAALLALLRRGGKE